MSLFMRRARGAILRLARHRARAIALGLVMAVPAAWVELAGRIDSWWLEGLSLVIGATGVALLWIGLTGASPDWIDHET